MEIRELPVYPAVTFSSTLEYCFYIQYSRDGHMKTSSPFLNEVVRAIRVRHYSIRTEKAYVDWVRRFIVFHNKRHPREMGAVEVGEFLTHLAVAGNVAASTQVQALNALVFLYRAVIDQPAGRRTHRTA